VKKVVALSALLMGLPMAASAGGFYIGAGIGSANVESTTLGNDNLIDPANAFQLSDTDLSFNINAGYDLNDHIAIDLMYADWGEFSDNPSSLSRLRSTIDMIALSGVFSTGIGDNFDLFGRLGVAFVNNDVSTVFTVGEEPEAGTTNSFDSEDMIYGFGADWNIDNFKVRLEFDWLNSAELTKARNISLSAIYTFNL
jgi:opacity protein-like surface antigen